MQLATEEQRQAAAVAPTGSFDYLPTSIRARWAPTTPSASSSADNNEPLEQHHNYGIGRYDENRQNMYESDLFDDTTNSIQDFSGRRTLHVGIDLDGPIGTPVHAFCPGIVHAVGKNTALGDYGNVIIVKHTLPPSSTNDNVDDAKERICYALYGHLDDLVPQQWNVGDTVAAGQCLGRMGAIHENGGWFIPHVHFQLALSPPVTHDLPGAVALTDRARALCEYPDPRYVLGPLY